MKLKSPFLDRSPRLELVSLLDVMFLVLVVFVAALFKMTTHHGVKVTLPNATGTLELGERIVITMCPTGELQLNGRVVDKSQLVNQASRLVKLKPEIPVIISADQAVLLGDGLSLLADLKQHGIQQISFQVRQKKK